MPIDSRWFVFLATVTALIAATPADAVKRRAFATSVTGTGNLNSWPDAGGAFALAAGDNICRARAAAASLPNAATYRAWLSTAATDAYCHVQGLTGKVASGCNGSPQPAGPWYRVNGTSAFTGTLDELTGAERAIYQSVRFNEFGVIVPEGERYFTGTIWTGQASDQTCSSWVVSATGVFGRYGTTNASAVHWTSQNGQDCSTPARLLCFEPGASEVTPISWSPAALAFVTSVYGNGDLSSWSAAGGASGIGAGDAICRNLAEAAHLPAPESFVAWLSTTTVDAADRLTLAGVAYRRPDGFRIAASKASLLASGPAVSLHVDETGSYIQAIPSTLTGTDETGQAAASHCLNWSSGQASEGGWRGFASLDSSGQWTDHSESTCNQNGRFYCFSNVVTIFWDGFDLTEDESRWSSSTP